MCLAGWSPAIDKDVLLDAAGGERLNMKHDGGPNRKIWRLHYGMDPCTHARWSVNEDDRPMTVGVRDTTRPAAAIHNAVRRSMLE